MPSVVIPAYNESAGIERCLRAVLADGVEDLAVVVVPNACRDDTAARARGFGDRVIVVDTPEGGKTNAINLGERTLRERGLDLFPRLFLDGDIELEPGTLRAILAEASRPGPRVVAAEPRFDASRSALAVRLYYAADRFNPYHRTTAPNGSGTYCVSREGRGRWGEFPPVIADDSYVERQFAASERTTVRGHHAVVRVPRTFRALRGISARKRAGDTELEKYAPLRADQTAAGGTLRAVAGATLVNPLLWPAFAVWFAIKCLERFEQRRVAGMSGTDRWQHDATSRS